jgi:hypothetical protein
MTTIARTMIGTLRLQDDLLKQATDRIVELEQELAFTQACNRLLEAKLERAAKQLKRMPA